MGGMQRIGDLELSQDLDFQRRSWRVQRIGQGLMLLVVLAALLGLLGGGPLSRATAGAANAPLQVDYGRFVRHGGPTQMDIRLQPGAAHGGSARVWLDRAYVDGIEIERIEPEPTCVEAGHDRISYVFTMNPPDQPATVTFSIMPDQMGLRTVRVGLDGGNTLTFRQMVYP